MYTLQSLWTMAREGLDVTVLIFANGTYNILRGELTNVGVRNPGPRAVDMLSIGGLVLVALIPLNFVISLRSLRFETKCLPMSTEAA